MLLIVGVAVVITLILEDKSTFNPSLAPYQVLMDLYDSTAGDNWYSNRNWLSTKISLCNWYGVTCDDNSESITKISLSWNRLQGSIPSSISNLSSLDKLYLSNNNGMSRTIPPEVCNLICSGSLFL